MAEHEGVKIIPPYPLTQTERRILDILTDGRGYTKKDLNECLNDNLSDTALKVHICKLRSKLAGTCIDVMCEGRMHYRLVRHYHPAPSAVAGVSTDEAPVTQCASSAKT